MSHDRIVRFVPRSPSRDLTPADRDPRLPGAQYGLLDGDRVTGLADPFLTGGLQMVGPELPLSEVELVCPARPSKILCVGVNYRAHAAEFQKEVPERPLLFFKPPSALVGSGEPIRIPEEFGRVDHEGELVLVIGRTLAARPGGCSADEARAAVFGLTCGNDVSARLLQKQDGQWTRAKGFDTFAPLGPYIVVGLAPQPLVLQSRVNGEQRQRASTADMVFDPWTVLTHITGSMSLLPGDLVYTGTPSGVGPLVPGDQVEVEIEGIGILTNPVVAR